jgi:hypothetical protein
MGRSTWKQVGVVGVDSGRILVADSCYWIKDEDYDKMSKLLDEQNWPNVLKINYDMGHEGKGVSVSSGYGDGTYPVEVKEKDGRIKELRVRFF